jgi:SHS2 domain-containing protein
MENPLADWEHFEHGADVGVRGHGATPEAAFEGAAAALCALLADDPRSVRESVEERVSCEAAGLDDLLVAFLNELIFLMSSRRLVLGRFRVSIERRSGGGMRLDARVFGEPIDPSRHEITVEPKGATFTALRVAREGGRFVAQCVVDV